MVMQSAPVIAQRRDHRYFGGSKFEREGVLFRAVEEGSPAQRAGIERGELIVAAAGKPLDRVDALYEALDGLRPGSQIELVVVRALEERTLTVTF